MNRSLTLMWLSVILMIAGAFTLAAAKSRSTSTLPVTQSAPAAGPKKAEEQFKNIQTLKGIPADQLIPTMQFIAVSLGVECDFCHVQNAFDKDDKKPKQTARKMMEMMFAINADNFDRHREVTCYSCHRGNVKPLAIPVVMTEESKEMGEGHPPEPASGVGETKQYSGPSADQILDKYISAVGGAAAIDKINSRVMKGTIDVAGKSFPIDIYSKDPDERISFTHMPEGESVTGFNGKEGWLGMTGRPLREMHGGDIDRAAIDADLHLATHLKQMFSALEVRGSEKIDGHDAYLVIGQREGKPPLQLYFDEQSGLLVRLLHFGDTALGLMPTQTDYADYREADGVKVPYRWTLARPNGRFTIQLTDLKQNVAIDDAKFVKPAPPPEPAHKP
jgi:photosynthetic reaction center cytochrome c subunit